MENLADLHPCVALIFAAKVDPKDVPVAQAGLLRTDYTPGDIGFDPLGLKPTNPVDLKIMQTKELQSKCLILSKIFQGILTNMTLYHYCSIRWPSCHARCRWLHGSGASQWKGNP